MVVVWRSGSALVSINEVNLRRARLLLGWVTVSGFSSRCRTFSSVCNLPPRPSHLGILSSVGAMSTSWRAMTPCGWGVKAGMGRVWVAGKTVWSLYTRPHLSALEIWHCKARYKLIYFTYFLLSYQWWEQDQICQTETKTKTSVATPRPGFVGLRPLL